LLNKFNIVRYPTEGDLGNRKMNIVDFFYKY
jgi:hypothetical protein